MPDARPQPTQQHILAALGDVADRCILQRCVDEAHSVRDVAEGCGLAMPTAYRHVHRLVEEGLLFVERSALTSDGKRYELYKATLRRVRVTFGRGGPAIETEWNEDAADRLRRAWSGIRERGT